MIIQKQRQQYTVNTNKTDNDNTFEDFSRILTSDKALPYKILNKKNDQQAEALFSTLVALGGKDYVLKNVTLFHHAITWNCNTQMMIKLIEVGGRELISEKTKNRNKPLHIACMNKVPIGVVLKLIEVGGEEIVLEKQKNGYNSLHLACMNNAPVDVVLKLIEVGGREIILEKDNDGRSSLHLACMNKAPIDVVSQIIGIGGREIVFEKNKNRFNSLHLACMNKAPIDVVLKLIKVGGREIVFEKDKYGNNLLHLACEYNASIDVVLKLIKIGGRELVFEKNKYGWNSLHIACEYKAPIEIFDILTQYGDEDLLMQVNNEGKTPLHYIITERYYYNHENFRTIGVERASYLINKGIQLQVGGEYSIGGLFNSKTEKHVQDTINEKWDSRVIPALEQVMALPDNQHQPILQALITNKALPHTIKDLVNRFPHSTNTLDSFNNYPIDTAVQHSLSWDDGMKQIVNVSAAVQQTTRLNICSRHGVQWENGTRDILESSDIDAIESVDVSTSLYPFMVAAVGDKKHSYDLDSVFHLIKSSPLLVRVHQQFGATDEEELF